MKEFKELMGIKRSKENEEFREFVLTIMEGYERFKKVNADIEFGSRSFRRSTIIKDLPTTNPKKHRK